MDKKHRRGYNYDVAEKYGTIEAVILEYISIYLNSNYKETKTEAWRDGYVWTFSTANKIAERIHGFNKKQIDYCLTKLVKLKLIKIEYYSLPRSPTRWLTIIDDELIQLYLNFSQPNIGKFNCRKKPSVIIDDIDDELILALNEDKNDNNE